MQELSKRLERENIAKNKIRSRLNLIFRQVHRIDMFDK